MNSEKASDITVECKACLTGTSAGKRHNRIKYLLPHHVIYVPSTSNLLVDFARCSSSKLHIYV